MFAGTPERRWCQSGRSSLCWFSWMFLMVAVIIGFCEPLKLKADIRTDPFRWGKWMDKWLETYSSSGGWGEGLAQRRELECILPVDVHGSKGQCLWLGEWVISGSCSWGVSLWASVLKWVEVTAAPLSDISRAPSRNTCHVFLALLFYSCPTPPE